MRRRWWVLALALVACGEEDIVIAHVTEADAGTPDAGQPPPGEECASNDDCAPDELCEKNGCDEPTGGCQLRPPACSDAFEPVCGCDQVTYYNDCLRRQQGAVLGGTGTCHIGVRCHHPEADECPRPGASCARIVPAEQPCPPDLPGACWVLPDSCPPPMSPEKTFRECGGAHACHTLCEAIRVGLPHEGVFCEL